MITPKKFAAPINIDDKQIEATRLSIPPDLNEEIVQLVIRKMGLSPHLLIMTTPDNNGKPNEPRLP